MADETATETAGEERAVVQAPAARIVSSEGRSTVVILEWPIEFEGTLHEAVTIRRVTGAEVDTFIDAVRKGPDGTSTKPPMLDCPREVYEAMDDDDRFRVEEAITAFLPKRLQDPLMRAASLTSADPLAAAKVRAGNSPAGAGAAA